MRTLPGQIGRRAWIVAVLSWVGIVALTGGTGPLWASTVYSVAPDMLAMEQASTTGQNPNGVWTYGAYAHADQVSRVFTPYGPAQHLENWGSLLPGGGMHSGEFQGYGFDNALAVPAIVVNTTQNAISPCCGISPYLPGEIFLHPDVDPNSTYQAQTIRFTAPAKGIAAIDAQFTQKHTGVNQFRVLVNGQERFLAQGSGQDTSVPYVKTLLVGAGDTVDFVIGPDAASHSFDANIAFTQASDVYGASENMLAMELASTTGANPNGPWTYGAYSHVDQPTRVFTAYTAAQHLENWGSFLPGGGLHSGEFQGYGFDNALAVPAIVVNTTSSSLSPCCGISPYQPGEIFLHPDVDPNSTYQAQTIRFTSPKAGIAMIDGLFTQKHTGASEFRVLVNGQVDFLGSGSGQDSSLPYVKSLPVKAGDTIDFAVGPGAASHSFDATVNIIPAHYVFRAGDDMLAMEQASTTGANPNGVWTYGATKNAANPALRTFTPYSAAQHLENWGSLLSGGGFHNGEFQGYGFDDALAVPAIVVNTTQNPLSPCCGISAYQPGEIFLHSWPDPADGLDRAQTIRFTAPEGGTAYIEAFFTQKHTGVNQFWVFLNGTEEFYGTGAGQDTSALYSAVLGMNRGDTLDFVIGGPNDAAHSLDITIGFIVPEPSALALALLGGIGLAALGFGRRGKRRT